MHNAYQITGTSYSTQATSSQDRAKTWAEPLTYQESTVPIRNWARRWPNAIRWCQPWGRNTYIPNDSLNWVEEPSLDRHLCIHNGHQDRCEHFRLPPCPDSMMSHEANDNSSAFMSLQDLRGYEHSSQYWLYWWWAPRSHLGTIL